MPISGFQCVERKDRDEHGNPSGGQRWEDAGMVDAVDGNLLPQSSLSSII